MERMHFQDGITLLAGVLLAAAPFFLTIESPGGANITWPVANMLASGAAAIALCAAALFFYRRWEGWLNISLGVWLVASPWVIVFARSKQAIRAAVTCGAIIAAMDAWRTLEGTGKRAY